MAAKPIRVIKQRKNWDCGLACLAMLLDLDYGDVSRRVRETIPVIPRRGLGAYHLEEIAASFDKPLRRIYRSNTYLANRPTGILGVNGGKMCWAGHWVMLKEGVVIEPWHEKRAIYGLDEYLKDSKSRSGILLVLED